MLFLYKAVDNTGVSKEGTIEAVNVDSAINALQRRNFIISSIAPAEGSGGIMGKNISIFERISNKDIVILSRQMATLFTAQVSALRIFRLIAAEVEKPKLARKLNDIAESLQGGSSISNALSKHPDVFSAFYINMVRSGEESGKLDETFNFLADYMDRSYEVTSKAKNALIYPAFVIFTFVAVMGLMLTVVIPKISGILKESGQDIPVYTKVVMGISDFLVDYGIFFVIAVVVGIFFLLNSARTSAGSEQIDELKINVPYIGDLYRKLYLARFSDTMNTMLKSGIPMVKALELSASTVDNKIYSRDLEKAIEDVKGGLSLSDSLGKYPEEFPNILLQMIKVGEETGNLGDILGTLAKFYQREVVQAVDTLVDLIEPAMIVLLGLGVGVLLASVLIPIYNISAAF